MKKMHLLLVAISSVSCASRPTIRETCLPIMGTGKFACTDEIGTQRVIEASEMKAFGCFRIDELSKIINQGKR